MRVLTLVLMVSVLAACATQGGAPPNCKGPYTPINHASTVQADGTQSSG
jgi:hypothetical protein